MKKKKIIVLIVLVLLVITALIIGYLYLATDTFKTNKELFFKSLANTQLIDNEFSSKYKSIFESESSSNYSSVGNIICSTSTQDNNANVADIKQLFNIKYNSLKNRNLEQDYADYTLNTNNEELMTVRYLRDGKTYGIKIENVLKKYLAVENNILDKSGAWYAYKGEKIGQGKENVKTLLRENKKLCDELEKKVRDCYKKNPEEVIK